MGRGRREGGREAGRNIVGSRGEGEEKAMGRGGRRRKKGEGKEKKGRGEGGGIDVMRGEEDEGVAIDGNGGRRGERREGIKD